MKSLSKKYILTSLYVLAVTLMMFSLGLVSYASDSTCPHNPIDFRAVEPTCVSVGYTAGVYCDLCDSFISGHEEIPFAEHKEEYREAVEPTCTESGYTEGFFCTVCETYISGHEEILAAHKGKTVPRQPETCTKDGYTEGVFCTVCETYISGHEVIPAAHREVYVPEEPATCTGNGYTAGRYCTVCNEFFWGHVEIPFKEHDFSEKIVDERHLLYAATVESPAVYRYDCLTCTAMSDTLTFTSGERLPLGATSALRATQSTSAIKLEWNPVAGAHGYRIYYYNTSSKVWKAVKDVAGTTVTFSSLPSATVYKFAVRAFTLDTSGKILSHDYTTIETSTKTQAPEKIASKQNTSAIKLMWTAVKGATGYRIYYKSGNTWKVCVSSVVETSYTFTGLPAGKTYQFAVRPYTIMSAGSVFGEYRTYVASTTPAAVKVTAVSQAPRYISLSWDAVSADGYQLYYKSGNGSYKLYNVYTSAQKLMFSGITSGSTYTFVVRAVKKTSGGYVYGAYTPVSVTVR